VGQGFSVDAGTLQAGSHHVTSLQGRCEVIGGDTVDALAGMARSAGHAGLASALTESARRGVSTFLAMNAVYQHVSVSLAASAETYASTERGVIARIGAILGESW
jgi:hypothetical protein